MCVTPPPAARAWRARPSSGWRGRGVAAGAPRRRVRRAAAAGWRVLAEPTVPRLSSSSAA
eukprot:scaffold103094_cov66-Phaeocystis_antarctica.AAC.1